MIRVELDGMRVNSDHAIVYDENKQYMYLGETDIAIKRHAVYT